jgi:triphosphatase
MAPSANVPSEVELKFLLSAEGSGAISANPVFANETMQVELQSVYYDTPDWDLRRAGVSLRVRREHGAFVQTVKRQAGSKLFDRGEWESQISGENPDRAAWAGTPAEQVLDAKGVGALGPVFSTAVRRTSRVLDEEGGQVEISLDHGKIVAGDLREPIDEVELELKGGSPVALFAIARRLAADTVLRLSFDSKAERGYRLAGGEALTAQEAQPAQIRGDMTGQEAFAQVARSCLTQVCGNAQLLREVRNPEALHQLRVGFRRLRAAFETFKSLLPRKGLDLLRAEIKWIGSELDPARDIDVFIKNAFPSTKTNDPGDRILSAFGERLRAAQTASYDLALTAVDSNRFALLLLNCAEWVEIGPWRGIEDAGVAKLRDGGASVLAGKALGRLSRQLRKSGKRLAAHDAAGRHRTRIKAKTLRYAGEFFNETFDDGGHGRRSNYIDSLEALQDALGELNDMATARRTALATAGNSAELAFCAGRIVGAREQGQPHLLKKAVRAYERWRRAKSFWR